MTAHEGRDDGAKCAFVCPACGGALWEKRTRGALRFECRAGDAFSPAELWIEQCAALNIVLESAQPVLAKNASLARRLAQWTRGRGDHATAVRLELEAAEDAHLADQVGGMLRGVPPPREGIVTCPEAR